MLALFGVNCMAQQIDDNHVAVVRYPQQLKKLTAAQLTEYANKRFKKGSRLFNAATRRPIFTSVVDDIIFDVNKPRVLNTLKKGETAADHIKEIKHNVDMWNELDTYTSTIETVNGNFVFIGDHPLDDTVRYFTFACLNKANTAIVDGRVTFRKDQKAQANQLLHELLNSISFKK